MKIKHSFLYCATFVLLTSCVKSAPTPDPVPDPLEGCAIVLNNGNWGSNDACISLWDPTTGKVTPNEFFNVNNQHLGDLGQDIVRFKDEIYISVNGSQIIFVTDNALKIKTSITAKDSEGSPLSPRYFACSEDKLYVSYYEGYLGEIDPVTHKVRITAVGPNPEGAAYAGGKVYVANSGGYIPGFCNTVSIVDAASFKEIATITVNTNPNLLCTDSQGTKLYVYSFGDYAAIQPKLQVVDLSTLKVKDLDEYTDVKYIAPGREGILYVATGSYNASWQVCGTIWKHDTATDRKLGKLTERNFDNFYSVSACGEYIFVGTGEYTSFGEVHPLTRDGETCKSFDSQGINPIKCIF